MEGDEAFAVVDRVLEASPADQTEALLIRERTALTRYANSAIHQNVVSEDVTLVVRAVVGKRIGVTHANRTGPDAVEAAVERARTLARAQKPNEDFVSLPEGGPVPAVDNFSRRTAASTPEERAEGVGEIVATVRDHGVAKAFGVLEATTRELTVASSVGARAQDRGTVAHLVVSAIHEEDGRTGYGRGEEVHVDMGKLDLRRQAETAARTARDSLDARDLEPGTHPVVLEDGASATLVSFLGLLAFGAQAYQEGRSYVSGRLGERVTGENVTVWDEGTNPAGLPTPVDAEGVPKQKVVLLEEGVARSVVHDSFTAGRADTASTGHALVPPNPLGPRPLHLFLEPGDASLQEMIEDTRRGVLVTRFHYTNPVDPAQAIVTGMTRDGTFLIEDGSVAGPVKNLRFTQAIPEALEGATHVGREWRPHRASSWIGQGATTVPPLRLEAFRFSGATEF